MSEQETGGGGGGVSFSPWTKHIGHLSSVWPSSTAAGHAC